MSNVTKKIVSVLPGNEAAAAELQRRIEETKRKASEELAAYEAAMAALVDKSEFINLKKCPVDGGKRNGVLISGVGKPQFFYPTHLLAIIGEGEQAERVRAKLRQQLEAMRAELTWEKAE